MPAWKTKTVLGLLLGTALVAQSPAQEQAPRDVGLREEAERRLVQVDVSVRGAKEVLDALTPADFSLKVMTRVIEDFTVDRVCRADATQVASVTTAPTPVAEATPAIRSAVVPTQVAPTTYLFYFDHTFMSLEGNNLAPQTAKELIPQLIRDGNRGTVVSSGRAVKTYADLGTDPATLIAGIDAMYADHASWWDPTQRDEGLQMNELMNVLNTRSADEAASVAKGFAADERWRAEKAYRRFSMVLGRLADLPQPKAVVYFADRLRRNPGQHYLSYFSTARARSSTAGSMLSSIDTDAGFGALSFDRVVNEANAHGARVYTVQAEGMTSLTSVSTQRAGASSTTAGTAGTRHITDAQNTLQSMASETGGQSFLHGVSAEKIAAQIEQDLSCVYLVSFDAQGFPQNEPVPVAIDVKNPKVKVQHRGQIFIQSDSRRLTSRLMAAFAAPDTVQTEGRVNGTVIPTGFVDGKYTSLVQLSVEGSPLAGATWDLGMSVLSEGKVREDAAERVTVGGAGTPVVFEKVLEFNAGPYEIVLVAHETSGDAIATGRIEGHWPALDEATAEVGPIAVMQPAAAVFLRDGQHKTRGALAHEPQSLLRTDRPTAIMSLACWKKGTKGRVVIERKLIGDSAAEFPPIEIDAAAETCAPILDQIPAGTMGEGEFVYEVHIKNQDVELAAGERRFSAVSATPAADAAAGTGS